MFLAAPWVSGDFAAHAYTPVWPPIGPDAQLFSAKAPRGDGRRKNPCARRYIKGELAYTVGVYPYSDLGGPRRIVGSGTFSSREFPHMATH